MNSEIKLYTDLLISIKERVSLSQRKVALTINSEVINLYWDIGRLIHEKQKDQGWGAKIIQKLAIDLKMN